MGKSSTNPENRQSVDQDMEHDEGNYVSPRMNQTGKAMAQDGFSRLDSAGMGQKERRGLSRPKRDGGYWPILSDY